MSLEVTMPQMGESVVEGTVTKWLVKVGDRVTEDQPLCEISTDKVDTEIPSPGAGIIAQLIAAEGQTLPIGAPIATIESGNADAAATKAANANPAQTPTAAAKPSSASTPAPKSAPAPTPVQSSAPAASAPARPMYLVAPRSAPAAP